MARARRGRGEGTVFFRKSDGFWIARVPARDEHGNPTRKQLGARKTKSEAQALLNAHAGGSNTIVAKGSLAEYLERWLRDVAKPRVEPGTHRDYENLMRRHVIPALGHVGLARLDAPRIAAFFGSLRVGMPTQRMIRVVLRSAYKQAVRWDLAPYNPLDRLDPPKLPRKERPTLDLDRWRDVFKLSAGERLSGMYVVGATMGLREGEIFALQWTLMKLDVPCPTCTPTGARDGCPRCEGLGFVGEIDLRHSLTEKPKLRLKELKRGRQRRHLPIPPIALLALHIRRAAAFAEGHGSSYVFCTKSGGPLRKRNFLRDSWHPLRTKLGLIERAACTECRWTFEQLDHDEVVARVREHKDGTGHRVVVDAFHFHDLRHTVGQRLRESGHDLETRRELFGHANVGITSDIYGHGVPQALIDAALGISALAAPPTPADRGPNPEGTVTGTVTPIQAAGGRRRRKRKTA
jgi:integrase